MKVLFAVSDDNIADSIIKRYQSNYGDTISRKNVYYFNAIIKELQKNKNYDAMVISEELEPFTNSNYNTIDKFLLDKLKEVREESKTPEGNIIPIIFITSDRRNKADEFVTQLFNIEIYNAIIGTDRNIEEVCRIMNQPRNKTEARQYYNIIESIHDSENDVTETEIQNILAHYKRLGKNEEKYIESFDNIAAQYNDNQLKIIIRFLPLNVKAVLEANSARYQQIMAFGKPTKRFGSFSKSAERERIRQKEQQQRLEKERDTKLQEATGQIPSRNTVQTPNANEFTNKYTGNTKMTRPVIIPSNVNPMEVKKMNKKEEPTKGREETNSIDDILGSISDPIQSQPPVTTDNETREQQEAPVKRGRGRPKKVVTTDETTEQPVKKGRGRPKKIQTVEGIPTDEPVNLFDMSSDNNAVEVEEDPILPGMADTSQNTQPMEESLYNNAYSAPTEPTSPYGGTPYDNPYNTPYGTPYDTQNDYGSQNTNYSNDSSENNYGSYNSTNPYTTSHNNYNEGYHPANDYTMKNNYGSYDPVNDYTAPNNSYQEETISSPYQNTPNNSIDRQEPYESYTPQSSNNILTKDKKVVAFVGTSKNGTSFIVNNIAQLMASMDVNTAILDMTQNRNSYYIYTKNDEGLRQTAQESIEKLKMGTADGIKVARNLTVYTALPGEERDFTNAEPILRTLIEQYSLVLIDCDFDTDISYFANIQEVYLVQSMDVLTIQPLTSFLRDLKAKNVLTEDKIRIIINKELKVRGINEKSIIGGMAFYNDPAMSFMTEVFNRNTVRACTIPFDMQVYSKYLEALASCNVTLNGYPKQFMSNLKALGNMVYPLLNKEQRYVPQKAHKNSGYVPATPFSNSIDNTLNQMKNKY